MAWIIGPTTDVVIKTLSAESWPEVQVLDAWVVRDWYARVDPIGDFTVSISGGVTKTLSTSDRYFVRPLDRGRTLNDCSGAKMSAFTSGICAWLARIPGAVMNRPDQFIHNGAKPLHEAILTRLGLRIPDSLTTCD